MKKRTTLLLALMMVFCLASCGGATAPETGGAEETAKTTETTISEAESTASETAEVTETTISDMTETAEESTADSTVAEAADSSETAKAPENISKMAAIYNNMDPEAGIHINYVSISPLTPDHKGHIDVHCKGGSFYRLDSTEGLESYDRATLIMEGNRYILSEEDKTYNILEGYPVSEDLMTSDGVYNWIKFCKDLTDFTTGEAELDGQTYYAEFFPESSDTMCDLTVCFREDGSLAGIIDTSSFEEGPFIYSINTIDDQVDESLFTYSGYTLRE